MAQVPATLPLYPRLLGDHWSGLDPAVRSVHLDESAGRLGAKGLFTVSHGRGRLVRLLVRLLRLPAEGDAVEGRLSVIREGSHERWCRLFAGRRLATVQYEAGRGLLAERFGLLELRFRLAGDEGALHYQPAGASVGPEKLMLRLPVRISPQVSAREQAIAATGRVRATVRIVLPVLGPLLTYTGEIEPESAD